MIEIKLGDRYAKSIMELAKEKGQVEEVRNDFRLIKEVIEQNKGFRLLLKSPVVPPAKKKKIVRMIFEGKLGKMTSEFVDIIVRKHREAYLFDIVSRFLTLDDSNQNITRGILTSAAPLSEAQRTLLKQKVEQQLETSLVLEENVDPNLIGGFVLRIGDRLFDGSIASGLKDLKQEFVNNPYVKLA